jgi:hypothetical protein
MCVEPEIHRRIPALLNDAKHVESHDGADENEMLVHSRRLPNMVDAVRKGGAASKSAPRI